MMNSKNLLLIIDPQNDFCMPNGALYVPDAENDMLRLSDFILRNHQSIDHIIVSQDVHHVLDIAHPSFWTHAVTGINPPAFTQITYQDVLAGKSWQPRFNKDRVIQYLKDLEQHGEFLHVIWPEHCIVGSQGAAIVDPLIEQLKNWERIKGKSFDVIQKGLNPYTEMFGIFRASIPDDNDITTLENKALINQLDRYDQIIVAGEAQSHCVAHSVKQLQAYPNIMKKIILLTDCMSNVTGFEHLADDIYKNASLAGVQFLKSTDIQLK